MKLSFGSTEAEVANGARELIRAVIQSELDMLDRWEDDKPILAPIDQVKNWALEHVQRIKGECRNRYIPDCSGQALVYYLKKIQAAQYLADPKGEYPFILMGEAEARGMTCGDFAELILAAAKRAERALAIIEERSYHYRYLIEKSDTREQILESLVELVEEVMKSEAD